MSIHDSVRMSIAKIEQAIEALPDEKKFEMPDFAKRRKKIWGDYVFLESDAAIAESRGDH